ncbi:MAG: response regulator [Gammaproteobacteria bacterium]
MNPKVLIVDDANFTRDLIRKAVRSRFPHFQMEEASNGKQAQGKLQRGQYDLILCDWEMPEMSGDELLAWIRDNEATRDLPFIMITSRGDKENVVEAIKLGVSNYVAKPFTTEKLVEAILKVLRKHLPDSALVPPQGSAPRSMGNDSANVLLGAQQAKGLGRSGDVPIAARIDKAEATAPARPSDATVRVTRKLLAQLRFGNATARCLVREIGLDGVTVVLKRDSEIPAILDLAVFDFDNTDGSGVSRINGYVHRLEARDPSQESEFVNLTLRFVDDDEEKRRQIRAYMSEAVAEG